MRDNKHGLGGLSGSSQQFASMWRGRSGSPAGTNALLPGKVTVQKLRFFFSKGRIWVV